MSDPSAIPSSLRPVRGRRRGAVSYVLVLAALAPGCGGAEEAPPLTPEVILARDRAADQASLTNWMQARETLRPLVERENAAVEDRWNLMVVEPRDQRCEEDRDRHAGLG